MTTAIHNALQVHPVADIFPLLSGEELDDLVTDIRQNGLLQPIVLDQQGRVLDGRNRLAACKRAGIEPEFVTYGGNDAATYALSVNIARRHLSKGQRAMIAAKAVLDSNTPHGEIAAAVSTSRTRVVQAAMVLEHAPELVDAVIAGGSLDDAYARAQQRKAEKESLEKDVAAKAGYMREHYPFYADLVADKSLTLAQAIAAIRVEEEEQRAAKQIAVAERDLQLVIEEIGPVIPLPPPPDLSINAETTDMQHGEPAEERARKLGDQQKMLRRLIRVVNELESFVALRDELDGPIPGAMLGAVRSGVSQIVAKAYHIADVFNTAEETKGPRSIK